MGRRSNPPSVYLLVKSSSPDLVKINLESYLNILGYAVDPSRLQLGLEALDGLVLSRILWSDFFRLVLLPC